MYKNNMKAAQAQKGFTLVELAIVMIIIGLLIGGVLKGQELIGNAQITSTVAQVKGIDAAATTFRDMYNAVPGDMLAPATRLPGCTVAPCSDAGNGDGRVGTAPDSILPSVAAGAAGENGRYWVHLSAADLITGVDKSSTVLAWDAALPSAKIGGGFMIGYTAGGTAFGGGGAAAAADTRGGTYLSLRSAPTVLASTTGVISPGQAARVDRKIDDGLPGNGTVIASGAAGAATTGTTCYTATGATGIYNEALAGLNCGVYIRIQQ